MFSYNWLIHKNAMPMNDHQIHLQNCGNKKVRVLCKISVSLSVIKLHSMNSNLPNKRVVGQYNRVSGRFLCS